MPCIECANRIYLTGANGAKPKQAAWIDNIVADAGEGVWAFAAAKTPQYNTYQARMIRPAPVVTLGPRG